MAKQNADEYVEIFARSVKLRNGKRIYASQYGLKAFHFFVKRKK